MRKNSPSRPSADVAIAAIFQNCGSGILRNLELDPIAADNVMNKAANSSDMKTIADIGLGPSLSPRISGQ